MVKIRFNRAEVQREFLAGMRGCHLEPKPSEGLIADGEVHRCNATNKEGNRGRNDGKYVLHLDGLPAGGFLNYTDGLGWTNWRYSGGGQRIDPEEHARQYRETRKRQARAHKKRAEDAAIAALEARELWDAGFPVKNNNPGSDPIGVPQYLLAKNIRAHGIRSGNRCLLVPMYSPQGKLVNLQRIYRKGDEFKKYFLKDARVVGCYFRMKATEKDDGTICVGTGFATCASINEASGHETYVAFTDANLLAVARMVREDNPDARIVICGDDDWKLVKKLGYNPGMVAAEKAARAVDGYVALPRSALPAKRRTPTSTT